MTTFHGRVLSVDEVVLGDELALDAAAGAVTITVTDAAHLDDDSPGQVRIGGPDGPVVGYSGYTEAADLDAPGDTVTLIGTLPAAAAAGDRVDLWDSSAAGGEGAPSVEWTAEVLLDDSAPGDTITAGIDHDLIDAMAAGPRSIDGVYALAGESVVLERDGSELVVRQILGRPLRRDLTGAVVDTGAGPGSVEDTLNGIYDQANENAAAAAEAALNGTAALATANGKNTVTYSANGPGNTPNRVGDIWWQRSGGVVVGQWQGTGGTGWEEVELAGLVIAYLDAAQLTAGSAFVNALSVKTNFTLGDASTNGVIQSHNFADSSVGVYIDKFGLVAKGGQLAAAAVIGCTVTGGVVRTAVSGNRLEMAADGAGGALVGYTGHANENAPARINPTITTSPYVRPELRVASPNFTAGSAGRLTLRGGITDPGVAPAEAEFNCRVLAPYAIIQDLHGAEVYADSQTGSTTEDAVIGNSGQIRRASSSRRYKYDVQRLQVDVDKLLALEPVTYRRRDETNGPAYPGFIAEEAADLELDPWVFHSMKGDVEGFRYGGWTAALQAIARHHNQRLAEKDRQIADLTTRVTKLEQSLLSVSASINLKGR